MKLFFTILTVLSITFVQAQNDQAYEFKTKPGTEEWKSFTTSAEMIQATSIPYKTIKAISSKALVETYLNYPLNQNQLAFNTPQEGFNTVRDYHSLDKETGVSYSLYKEILNLNPGTKRKDISKSMIKKYQTTEKSNEESRAMDIYYLQMMMAQKEFIAQLTSKEKKTLIELAIDKQEIFKEMPFRSDLEYTSIYMIANLLEGLENQEFTALIKTDRFLKFSLYSGKQLGGDHWKKVLDIGRKQI